MHKSAWINRIPSIRIVSFLLFGLFASALLSSADTIVIGLFSVDQPFSDNQFTVSNYTGSNSLPPDAPVEDPLTLQGVQIQYFLAGGSSAVLGPVDVAPGSTSPFAGETFDPSVQITEAIITGTLSSGTFNADVGSGPMLYAADDVSFSTTLLPSMGSSLIGGLDFVPITIDVSPASDTSVPEPSVAFLVLFGFTLIWRLRQTNR
jgi:hypothetical protein